MFLSRQSRFKVAIKSERNEVVLLMIELFKSVTAVQSFGKKCARKIRSYCGRLRHCSTDSKMSFGS